MNFKQAIEEIKKGKKVRRKGEYGWLAINNNNELLRYFPNPIRLEEMGTGVETLTLKNIESILSNDWEVVEEKKKWWKPKRGEKYFIVNNTGYTKEIYPYVADGTDELHIKFGNYFQTEEEAEFMGEKLKVIYELEKFAYENNEEEIDWNNEDQRKFFLYYSYSANQVLVNYVISMKEIPFNVYFTSDELAKKAIETIGEDRIKKYYFGVKDE